MKVALAQIRVEAGAVETNVARAVDAIERAAAEGIDLVVLPELFTVGYFAFDSYARTAEGLDGETLAELEGHAVEHDIAILAGTVVEDLEQSAAAGRTVPAESGLANTAVFIDRDGTQRAVYRKHHLFGYGSEETDRLVAGERRPTVEFEGFTVGITTCYDLRFPELYRELLDAGVTMAVVPSAWPYPRVEHWTVLPRARAVENHMYVLAANGVGAFGTATLLGRSTVYDPWGTAIASAGEEPALVTASVDPATVDAVREEFPTLDDRRAEFR